MQLETLVTEIFFLEAVFRLLTLRSGSQKTRDHPSICHQALSTFQIPVQHRLGRSFRVQIVSRYKSKVGPCTNCPKTQVNEVFASFAEVRERVGFTHCDLTAWKKKHTASGLFEGTIQGNTGGSETAAIGAVAERVVKQDNPLLREGGVDAT
jgi:hypothetical protein